MADHRAVHRIAEIAWRDRNPKGKNFTPATDARHGDMVEAAELFVKSPAAAVIAVRALRQIGDFGPEPVTEAMVEQAFEAAFPGLPDGMTVEEAKRRVRAALEAVPSPARLQARGALMAIGELDEGAGT